MSEDEDRLIVPADPKAYQKEIAGSYRRALPGGLPEDRELKASPYLVKALKEREWIV